MGRGGFALVGLAALASVFGGNPCFAADLPYKAPLIASAPYDWSGFYVGGNVGVGRDHRDATIFNSAIGAVLATGSTHASGMNGGGQIGFNYALTPNWIAGLEVDISAAQLENSAVGAAVFGRRDNKIDMFGSARGRLGYAWNRILLYGTGGFAWANEQMVRTQQIGIVNLAAPGTMESSSVIAGGWAAGGGLEFGFAPHWSAKLEYLHLSLGSQSFAFPLAAQRIDATARIDVVRLGLNYRFGG